MTKTCTKCGVEKPATNDFFSRRTQVKCGWQSWCKSCDAKHHIEWRESLDPEARKKGARRRRLSHRYKITPEQYDSMLSSQGGHCGICDRPPVDVGVLHVDHDHGCCPGRNSCGECVRGLLCFSCNAGMGSLDALLANATAYLSRTAKGSEGLVGS